MSLYVDYSKVVPAVTNDEHQNETVFAVGTVLMVCAIPKLETLGDLQELLVRVRFYEKLNSPIFVDGQGKSRSATVEFWKRWFGVRVNVSKEPRAAFQKRIVGYAISDIDYAVSKEVSEIRAEELTR